jgi:TctA family transporter
MFVLPVLTLVIPGKAGDTVGQLVVSEAGAAMLRTDQPGPGLDPMAGALIWTLYLGLAIGAAVLATNRRDA